MFADILLEIIKHLPGRHNQKTHGSSQENEDEILNRLLIEARQKLKIIRDLIDEGHLYSDKADEAFNQVEDATSAKDTSSLRGILETTQHYFELSRSKHTEIEKLQEEYDGWEKEQVKAYPFFGKHIALNKMRHLLGYDNEDLIGSDEK